MQPDLTIRCLGEFEIDGLPSQPRGLKQTALLAYLATNLGKPCSRSTLISVFWGERFDDHARQSLRQALSALGKTFRPFPGSLHIDRHTVRLDPARVSVDLIDAHSALKDGSLELAASIFRRGIFLEKAVAKEPALADWLVFERTKWAELTRQAVLARARQLFEGTCPVAAEEMTNWLLRQDPLDEAAVRLAMKAKAASGSVAGAIRLYKQFESAFTGELGVAPSPETVACFEELGQANGAPAVPLIAGSAENDHRPRVMVLPFTDPHAGPDGSLMADSLTDEVISALGRFPELAVTGRNTSLVYRDTIRDLPGLVRDLGIQYVVSGTVRRLGDHLRIGIELDDAVAQQFVSSERRDCRMAEFYDVQEDIARAIAGAIVPELMSATTRKCASRPIASLALWEKALVARGHLERGTRDSILASETLSLEILEEDPDQLMALKVLAFSRYVKAWNFWTDDINGLAENSMTISEKILERDPFDADALSLAARCHITLKNYDRALELAEYSVEMNPSNAQSHVHLGASYSHLGRYHEALAHFAEARRISPRDRLVAFWDCAEAYAKFGLKQYDEVVRISGASAKKPGTWAWTRFILAVALVKVNSLDEARSEVKKLRSDYPHMTVTHIKPLLKSQYDHDFSSCLKTAGLPEK